MSAPIALLLEAARWRAFAAGTNTRNAGSTPTERVLVEGPFDPNMPEEAIGRLRDQFGAPSSIVLVIGLGFLEIARPDLPPLSPAARHALLRRDADRYFPIDGRVAVAWADGFAFALPDRLLTTWVRAFEALAPIDAVLALPQACANAAVRGAFTVEGASGEYGVIAIQDGAVREARRIASIGPDSEPLPPLPAARQLDSVAVLRAALSARTAPIANQLLDDSTALMLERRRRQRVWRSAALLAAAVVALGWSADRWRTRELDALRQRVVQLTADAAPAKRALFRFERAQAEEQLLAAADRVNSSGTTPGAILGRLGTVLPKDAFVQRLDWDGSVWRIDGSASDAPRIVPLLDADPHFSDVRIVAASARFLDGGRQRESFSISFRAKSPVTGGSNAR